MKLNFLGTGSCFADDHASAFFVTDENDLVLIDCSEQTFKRLKNEFELFKYRSIFIYITHTHPDHISGLSSLIFYAYLALKKHMTVVAPSSYVGEDLKTLLKIEGVENYMYTLAVTGDYLDFLTARSFPCIPNKALGISVLTEHVPTLKYKCFGYVFSIDKQNIVYTGDTNTLNPFLVYLKKGSKLYVDTSVLHKTDAHLYLDDMLPTLKDLVSKGIEIYLMHLDDEVLTKNLVANIPGIEVVEAFKSEKSDTHMF